MVKQKKPDTQKASTHGGKRPDAGRPKKAIKTVPMRVPIDLVDEVERLKANFESSGHSSYKIPIFSNKVSAGFGSIADTHIEAHLDLAAHLISNPEHTFCVHVQGQSMQGAGLHDGDLITVDSSLEITTGQIVVAHLEGELFVKRFHQQQELIKLLSEHPDYPEILIKDPDFRVLGVVTHVVRKLI